MDSSFRIGIDPHWERKWQTIRKTNLAAVRSRLANELIPALEHYACTGEGKRPIVDGVQVAEVKPNHGDVVMKWEHYVYSDLIGYAFARQLEFEVQAVDEGRCDEALAMHAFASAYISQLIELHIHNRFPLRFGGRRRAGMYPAALPFTVLGLLMGATQAVDLARMQLAAYRRGDYFNPGAYPIYEFTLGLLCDAVAEHTLDADDPSRIREPVLLELLHRWRSPDPHELADVLLASCDFHTHRCRARSGKLTYEFESHGWNRTPFEILLVLKLRQKLGLENPELDHPLMNTAIGRLPREIPYEPDGLISRVHARLMQDGFDENAIYRKVMTG